MPSKGLYLPPPIIHCPVDHLRMSFRPGMNAYRCNLPGCAVVYSLENGYYRLPEEGDVAAREAFYGREGLCLCEKYDWHWLYVEDFVANRMSVVEEPLDRIGDLELVATRRWYRAHRFVDEW